MLLQSGCVLIKLLWCCLILGSAGGHLETGGSAVSCLAPPNAHLDGAIHSQMGVRPAGQKLDAHTATTLRLAGQAGPWPADRQLAPNSQRFYGGLGSENLASRFAPFEVTAQSAKGEQRNRFAPLWFSKCYPGLNQAENICHRLPHLSPKGAVSVPRSHPKLQQECRRDKPMNAQVKERVISDYRALFQKYGDSPEATGMSSEGHLFRFRKLAEIADLRNHRVLDIGCGIGAFYPFLIEKFGRLEYTGIDIVPETVEFAAKKYPGAHFLCRDLAVESLDETFDYVFISTVFNKTIPGYDGLMWDLLTLGFKYCTLGLGFNFLSTYVNFTDAGMAYYDPAEVLDFCIRNLTRKVVLHHHYERVDVAVFAYR
jgi:SAM-dependent methyltransferase